MNEEFIGRGWAFPLRTDATGGIALISSTGEHRVSLNETRRELHVVTQGKLKIEADELEVIVKRNATIKAQSGMSLEAAGQMSVKGATVAIN